MPWCKSYPLAYQYYIDLEETKTIPSRERRLAFIEIEKKSCNKKVFFYIYN